MHKNVLKVYFAGGYDTTVLLTNGDYYSCGFNEYGQLGNGTTNIQSSPLPLVMSADWQEISQGSRHTLALKEDGTFWAWGYNEYGL